MGTQLQVFATMEKAGITVISDRAAAFSGALGKQCMGRLSCLFHSFTNCDEDPLTLTGRSPVLVSAKTRIGVTILGASTCPAEVPAFCHIEGRRENCRFFSSIPAGRSGETVTLEHGRSQRANMTAARSLRPLHGANSRKKRVGELRIRCLDSPKSGKRAENI